MLDEEMDHMIRDAAENHHPAYNDQAWDKMEKLLDKHLPQKTDNRRYIFFLLLFLLLGGGTLFSIYQLNDQDDHTSSTGLAEKRSNETTGSNNDPATANTTGTTDHSDNTSTQSEPGNVTKIDSKGTTTSSHEPVAAANTVSPSHTGIPRNQPGKPVMVADADGQGKNTNITGTYKRSTQSGKGRTKMRISAPGVTTDKDAAGNDNDLADNRNRSKKNTKAKNKVSIQGAAPEEAKSDDPVEKKVATEGDKEEDKTKVEKPAELKKVVAEGEKKEEVKEEKKEEKKEEAIVKKEEEKKKEPVVAEKKPASPDKKQSKSSFASNFGITVSVGPDVSFVSLDKLGKATIMYGAGLSYTFAKQRLTVRTGFYASNKIYDARPDQYHPPGGTYPYLYNVAAECMVYEIPVSVSYNFGQRKKHNWFGGAGLSSFLMKSEEYNYQYKTPTGQFYNYPWEVKNENKHYFSVLTLSAGYNYRLSKRVSLQAEPYVKIPLGGVGNGQVKLNSGGILFTATIRPFAKK